MGALGEPLLLTVEQFDLLPEREDVLEELHWGQLVTLSRLKAWHVKLQMKLTQLLQPLAAGRGYIVTELPFRAVAEYDLRAADVAFVSKARWDEVHNGYLLGAPELVIEIPLPSNTKNQIREYAALCLANGSEEFWLVDNKAKAVTVTRKNGQSLRCARAEAIPIHMLGGAEILADAIFA